MSYLQLTNNQLNPEGYWNKPLKKLRSPSPRELALFDQNGYDLTNLEKNYAKINLGNMHSHREHRFALKAPWFIQAAKNEGAVLNHSLLFERKGYAGEALEQLELWAQKNPLLSKSLKCVRNGDSISAWIMLTALEMFLKFYIGNMMVSTIQK